VNKVLNSFVPEFKNSTTMHLRILLIGLVAGIISLTGFSQPPSGNLISLQECLKRAVDNSPKLKISLLEQSKLKYKYHEAFGKGLPSLNFSGSLDDFVSLPTQLIPGEFFNRPGELIPVQFGTTYNLNGTLDATQMIYNQAYLVAVRLSRQLMEENELSTEKFKTTLLFEVAQSYYLTQVTRKQIQNQESNLEKFEKAEKIAQSLYESGLIKKVDVDRIVIQKLNLMSDIDRLHVLFEQELSMQRYYMGFPMDQPLTFPDSVPLAAIIPGNDTSFSNHIDIRMIEMKRELAGTNLKLNYSEYYPSLTFIGNMTYTNQNNSYYVFGKPTDWFNTSLIGLRLNVPVFSGFQKRSKVSQSKVDLLQIQINEDDTRKLLRIQSQDAARKLLASIDAEKRQRLNVTLADKVYGISLEQYQKGIIPLTDLLNSETALSDAQTGQTYALIQMKIAELEYMNANGTLLKLLEQK
jgi:outer membrane protein